MTPIQPRFGSIYVIKTPSKLELCQTNEEFIQVHNNVSRATAMMDSKWPVSMIMSVGGGLTAYQVTLTDGTQKHVLFKGDPDYAVAHIVSGTDSKKSNNAVDRSFPKQPIARLQNLWRKFVQKQPPLTVEQASDLKVEAVLKQNNVKYTKLSFEEAGR